MTLAELVSRVRRRLEDTVPDTGGNYLWGNALLVDYVNDLLADLALTLKLVDDQTTTSTCQVAVLDGVATATLSPLVTHILSAYLTDEDYYLTLYSAQEMDAIYGFAWRDTDEDTPSVLVTSGMGDGVLGIYPKPDANYTLNLVVRRRPLTLLDWDTDQATTLPVPAHFHHLLTEGVLAKAYNNPDVDAFDPKRAETFDVKYRGNVETMRRVLLKNENRTSPAHHPGVF